MRGWCLVKWKFRGKDESAPLNMPLDANGSPDVEGIKATLRILLDDTVVFVSAESCPEPAPIKVDTGWCDL